MQDSRGQGILFNVYTVMVVLEALEVLKGVWVW